jgi:hypothetical protein
MAMKYLKQLKNELADLTQRLGGQVFDGPPSHMANRARLLQSLVDLLQQVSDLDDATDDWSEGNATQWFLYLGTLESWISMIPKVPEK